MTKSTAVTAVVAAMATALVACAAETAPAPSGKGGSSSSSSSTGSSGTSGVVQEQDNTETKACVVKGAKANDKGVGAYCDKTTRCANGAFCTGDFGAPVGAQFCTLICEKDSDCGSGSVCFEETRGKGCVPTACLDK